MQNNIEKDFLDYLSLDVDSLTGELLLLIESGAFAYSILRRWGYRMHYPVAVTVKSQEMADVIASMIGIFSSRLININMSPKAFTREITEYQDDVLVFTYSNGRNAADNLEFLLSICTSGRIGENEVSTPLLVIFPQVIPEEYQDRFSLAFSIEKNASQAMDGRYQADFLEALKDYVLRNSQFLEYKIQEGSEKNRLNEVRDGRFWDSVITMLEMAFEEEKGNEEHLKLRSRFETAIKKGSDLSFTYEFSRQIPSAFMEAFIAFIPKMGKMINKSMVSELNENALRSTILFDSDYYYIPDELFTFICEPLKRICTLNQIKSALERYNILCTQGKGRIYRTIKLSVKGVDTSPRFVWLRRSEIDGDGFEMTLEEKVNCRKDGR